MGPSLFPGHKSPPPTPKVPKVCQPVTLVLATRPGHGQKPNLASFSQDPELALVLSPLSRQSGSLTPHPQQEQILSFTDVFTQCGEEGEFAASLRIASAHVFDLQVLPLGCIPGKQLETHISGSLFSIPNPEITLCEMQPVTPCSPDLPQLWPPLLGLSCGPLFRYPSSKWDSFSRQVSHHFPALRAILV